MSALCSTSSSATSATPASASYLRMLPSMSLPTGLRLGAPGEMGDDDCNGVGDEDNVARVSSQKQQQQEQPSRKNKRKNFQPRNIRVLDDEVVTEEANVDCDSLKIRLPQASTASSASSPSPLDLSENAAAVAVASNSSSALSALKRTLLWPVKVSCSAPTMSDHLNHLMSPQAIQTGNSDCSDPPREDEGEDENDEDEEDDEDDRVRDVEAPRDPVDLTLKLDCDNGDMMDQDEDSGDEEFMGEEDAEEDSDGEGSEHQPTQLSEAEVQHSLWLLHNQYLAQQQQQPPNKSSHSNEASMQDYAESTMKELLSLYGLQRHDSAPLNHKVRPPSPHLEQKSRAEISRSVLASPRPSSIAVPQTNGSSSHHVGVASNPPTPPHTPKLDPSLAALQAHMQNVLRAAAQENHAHLTNSHGSSSGLLHTSAANLSLPRTNSLDRSCTFTPNMAAYMAMAASTSFAPPQQQLLMHGRRLEERGGGGGLFGGRKDSLQSGGGRLLSGGAKTVPIDYTRYVKRFSSALECGSHYCKDLNYREHFHCLDCNARVFVKKEEMIRHFKWHKKRDESLQHGFMRYSPMDDCSDRFRGCSHNRKQTHYHCLKDGCDKVYISTSDVQMHANYHRKDSAIIQEGFQRFRATEDCQTSYCAFNGQRTTHFHCRRGGCLYTFKNKADMEKHKTYHIKDEQLTKDGFKKFMKNETCTFEACRFSKVCNHIHCIRPGCNYVLHSSGQLYSHKRKHERRDNELAYRKYKLAQSVIKSLNGPGSSGASASADGANAFPPVVLSPATLAAFGEQFPYHSDSSLSESFSAGGAGPSTPPAVLPISFLSSEQQQQQQQSHLQFLYNCSRSISPSMLHSEAALERKLLPLSPGQPCPLQCELTCQEHWHCAEENCSTAFRSRDAALDHVRQHMQQEQITALCYVLAEPGQGDCPASCPMQARGKHYHCLWEGCGEVILPQDKPFRRLDHFKMHEYTRRMSLGVKESPSPSFVLHPGALGAAMAGACPQGFTLDSVFRRKRGRPPKNRVIEVWNECMSTAAGTADLPQAIFTSFKLPKPNSPPLPHFLSPASFAAVKAEPMSETSAAATNVTQTSAIAASPSRMSDSPLKGDAEAAGSGRDSFYPIPAGSVCPDPFCLLAGTSHFHCAHPRCCSALESASALGPHVQQLHSQQDILEGFVYFDRLVDCRLPTCTYNKQEGHFHCVRPACGLTFTKPSAMLSHEHCRDNKSNENGESGSPRPASASTPTEDNTSPKTVKAAGTFYPIPAFKSERSNSREGSCSRSPSPSRSPVTTPSAKDVLQHQHRNPSPLALIKAGPSAQAMAQIEMPLLYGPASSCGRPFCKLKRREHYHCVVCNQAFSELERLQPHMLKHCSGALQWGNKEAEDSDMFLSSSIASSSALASAQQRQQQVELMLNGPPESSSPLPLPPPPYMPPFGILPTHSMSPSFLPPHLPPLYSSTPFSLPFGATPPQLLGSKRPSPSPTDLSPTDAKKLRFPTSMRILKDEPVPEGYIRYRFNEDCGYQQCGYREHQTHFHCMRPDCGYSFCDKTRFVQHTARHERLDTLMGGDFAQYRAAVPCGRSHCLYTAALGSVQNKASHFHCLKCDFVCTDTNKVVAHRRQHQKTDSILAAGFEKFTPAQVCRGGAEACPHSTKQTHYHCLKCGYAVLGLSQMSAHKYRHMEGN